MKSWITTTIATVMVLGMGASTARAGEVCTPVPPKDVQGHFWLVYPGPSIAGTYFENNGCSWNGLDALNGTDAIVLDVSGMAGPATMLALIGRTFSPIYLNILGHFLDASCQRIPDANLKAPSWVPERAQPELITIPATARWVVFDGTDGNAGSDFDMVLHSDGKECPVAPPRKKRKH